MNNNIHANTPLLTAGPSPDKAAATLILLHGRGSSADDILSLYPELNLPTLSALAPQAANHTWYPHSFLSPIPTNQPYLDSAIARIESIIQSLLSQNIPASKIAILGFSQGACLAAEYVALHPRPYGALISLSGGLILTQPTYPGSLLSVPILLASSDPDPHVPFSRVQQTADTFTQMGATVDLRRYPNQPHSINPDQFQATRALLQTLSQPASIRYE